MLYAIIEHKNNTLIMEFPCRRMTMAEHLASVGIRTPAHEIKCADEENIPIKVKIFGESEFGKKLASVISAEDTLSLVNSFCEMYQNMPYANKQDIMEAVLQDKVASLQEFGRLMMQRREQDVTEHYYCPLSAMVYPRNDYGDLEDYPDEYDGSYLAVYEDKIRDLIKKEECLTNVNEVFEMISITITDLSKEILRKIEEMPWSRKYKDALRCQGVRKIQQYFNDHGQEWFHADLLLKFLSEVNEKYQSGMESKCHWQLIYRCAKFAYEICAPDMVEFNGQKWITQVVEYALQPFYNKECDKDDIRSLIVHTMQNALYENDYSEKTRKNYTYGGFYTVLRFFMKHDTTTYSESLLRRMLDDEYSRYRQGEHDSSTFRARRKIIEWIVEFHDHGTVSRTYLAPFSYTFASASYECLLDEYQSYMLANEYLKESSLRVYALRMRQFFKKAEYDGIDAYEKLELPYVVRYITEYGKYAPCGVHEFFHAFRSFSGFLKECRPELPILTDALVGSPAHHKKVYDGYTRMEAETILNSIDRSSDIGKRDYAIIMLAYNTGLRAVDIADLTLQDIDWNRCEIRICQSKTAVPLALPLDVDTGNAVADYILHARPDTELPNIFLRTVRPFDKMKSRSVSAMVTRYAIHTLGKAYHKKHGTHAFRRGIGVRMLNAGVPVQTIQDVLGHSTSHALPQYTAVAWDGLRMCMPDFADVPVMREELK